MIIKRPSIFIYTHEADPTVVKDVCAGIEEEGIFYDVTEMPDTCMEKLAYKAARDSMLGSGVGIYGTAVCLKMRGLEKGRNIESYLEPTRAQCRCVGSNSARAIIYKERGQRNHLSHERHQRFQSGRPDRAGGHHR